MKLERGELLMCEREIERRGATIFERKMSEGAV